MNLEDDDIFENPPYHESGLICEVCGYTDSLKCYIDTPEEGQDPDNIYCGEHAAKNGYCCCCGLFYAGTTGFDFHHPGYCDNCYEEVRDDYDEDGDYDYYY